MKKSTIYVSSDESFGKLFTEIKSEFLKLDPVAFTENYLKLDGEPFKVSGSGWKFMSDIYRYIALKAVSPDGKPIVILKGRQVGATVMAGALDLYFTASGLFGFNGKAPITILHCFPNLTHMKRFSQLKLDSLINTSTNDYINQQKSGYNAKTKRVSSSMPDNMTLKQFNGGCNLWIESLGDDGDRIRGMTCDAIFFDECFPYDQFIELADNQKKKIGTLYNDFIKNKQIPLVKTFNEALMVFEYKKITNAWCRGKKQLLQINCGNKIIRCTENHKFLTENGWMRADELKNGDLLKTSIGTDLHGYAVVDKVFLTEKIENVYDIEVEDNHNFILAPSGREDSNKNNGGPIAHNCQDMSPTAIGVALKTLVAAKYGPAGKGIEVFFGTPKARGSYFETGLWNQSDKRYYFLGCTNKECQHYFMLSTPGTDEWKNIWLFGQTVKCPQCGNEEDKRVLVENGKWIPTEPTNIDGTEKKFVGYHISQLYVPTLDKDYILDQHPDNNKASSERIYYNEALGEFYSGNDMPISKDEIELKCKDADRSFCKIITTNERKTWMGIDWGGKVDSENSSAGQSYSCAAVISADSSGTLSLEFAYRLKSTDLQYKIEFVKSMYKNYNLRLAVADWGYGHDVCTELQKIYGSKLITAETSGNLKKNVVYDKDLIRIKWNKDYFIEEIFDLMRKGKVRFPWKSFEHMSWLIDHITSMELRHSVINGQAKKIYDKGSLPNDGLMSIIYAYLAYKFDVSNGFSSGGISGAPQLSVPMPKLAYVPKMK